MKSITFSGPPNPSKKSLGYPKKSSTVSMLSVTIERSFFIAFFSLAFVILSPLTPDLLKRG